VWAGEGRVEGMVAGKENTTEKHQDVTALRGEGKQSLVTQQMSEVVGATGYITSKDEHLV